ncbi:HAD family hydrolase [Hydrogenophaga sp.]|uniref:HAD family hydrolase n=1 Tax=Hydrogenophaga sp. TaxID=1904254 RepID=UPI0035B48CEF
MPSQRFAFFDVDETLIGLKSMFSFRAHFFRQTLGQELGRVAEDEAQRSLLDLLAHGASRLDVNRHFYRTLQGYSHSAVCASARDWYAQHRQTPGFFVQPVLERLRAHQADGVGVALVSGSCAEILLPLAQDLGVEHLLVTQLDLLGGVITGEVLGMPAIGEGKRLLVQRFLQRMRIDPVNCLAYGDHLSDLPMLELVGHPVVVVRDDDLVALARSRRWPLLLP